MNTCTECGDEVGDDDVACPHCGAHQWRRRITQAPARTTAIREHRPFRRRDTGRTGRTDATAGNGKRAGARQGDGTRGDGGRGDGRSTGPVVDPVAAPHTTRAIHRAAPDDKPARTDRSMLRVSVGRSAARATERRRTIVAAVLVCVVAPLLLGLGVVALGQRAGTPDEGGPEWVLVLDSVSKTRTNADALALTYRGAPVVVADGDEHPSLTPGAYVAIADKRYASRRAASADCGTYGRTDGAQCRPVRIR